MKRLNKKGFTLIELLAVIIILGVLLLIAVPSVQRYIRNSRINTYKSNMVTFLNTVKQEVAISTTSFDSNKIYRFRLNEIPLEKGNNSGSPFADWYGTSNNWYSYILLYNGKYYLQALDKSGYGIEFTDVTNVVTTSQLEIKSYTLSGLAAQHIYADGDTGMGNALSYATGSSITSNNSNRVVYSWN